MSVVVVENHFPERTLKTNLLVKMFIGDNKIPIRIPRHQPVVVD
jgi:hypothetical protein